MFCRSVSIYMPSCVQQARGMATLKEINMRVKSVTNIQKITKSMKMVSAAKFAKAERELRPARPYGHGARAFFEKANVLQDETMPNHLVIAMCSDRGLCGGVHSNIVRQIKQLLKEQPTNIETKLAVVGDKARSMLKRYYSDKILMHFSDLGKRPPVFADAAFIADSILKSGYDFDHGTMYFNVFRSVVAYRTESMPIFSLDNITRAEKLNVYDSIDEDVLQSYNEYAFASLIYFAMKESATSEQSSRMTAMDAASKNAGEMIERLTLTYNRTRQAVITRELIEIISGAACLE